MLLDNSTVQLSEKYFSFLHFSILLLDCIYWFSNYYEVDLSLILCTSMSKVLRLSLIILYHDSILWIILYLTTKTVVIPMTALKYFDNHIYRGILSPLLYPMWIISLMNCSHKTLLLVLPASMFTSSTIASSFHSATSCSKLTCSQIDCNKKYKNNYTLYQ